MAEVIKVARVEDLVVKYDQDGNQFIVARSRCVKVNNYGDFEITYGPDGERRLEMRGV